MIQINKDAFQDIIIDLHSVTSISNPYYAIKLIDPNKFYSIISPLVDLSPTPQRYSQFHLDPSVLLLMHPGEANYFIYESSTYTTDPSLLTLIWSDTYKCTSLQTYVQEVIYESSIAAEYIYGENTSYDPSSSLVIQNLPLTLDFRSDIWHYEYLHDPSILYLYYYDTLVATNASVNNAFLTNASLGKVGVYDLTPYATNVSVNKAFYSNASLGLAFNQYTNASLGYSNPNFATNSSVNSAFVTNVSLGFSFNQYANASLGLAGGQGGLTRIQIDASYATNASVNSAFTTNVSLGYAGKTTLDTLLDVSIISPITNQYLVYDTPLWKNKTTLDASLFSTIDASILFYTIQQIDASFATNASVNSAFITNASLGKVGVYDLTSYATNVSVNTAFIANVSLGFAFNQYTNASLGLAFNQYTNASLGYSNPNFATNASVNSAFITNVSLGIGVSKPYVDGSLAARDASLNRRYPLTSYVNTSSYYDASLINIINSFYSNASLGLTGGLSRAQIDASYATNASVGLAFYSNPSLGLAFNKYTNASLGLAFNQYTNASLGKVGVYDLTPYATNVSVNSAFLTNASLGLVGTSVDASLNQIYPLIFVENTSIGIINASLNDQFLLISYVNSSSYYDELIASNASVNSAFITNVSLGLVGIYDLTPYATNVSVNSAIANFSTNASVNDAFLTNASLGYTNPNFATNASVNMAFFTNVSLGILSQQMDIDNVSIGIINASLNDQFLLISYVNSSSYYDNLLSTLNASVNAAFTTNASVNLALLTNVSLGLSFSQYACASLGNIFTSLSALKDVSIVNIISNNILEYDSSFNVWTNVLSIDASNYFISNSHFDSSISPYSTNASVNNAFLTNASLGLAFNRFTNASLGLANNSYATNASVNTALLTNASLGLASNTYYGGLYSDVSINQSTTTNYTLYTPFNRVGSNSGITCSSANDKMTILTAGLYNVMFTTSLSTLLNNSLITMAVYYDGVIQNNMVVAQKMGIAASSIFNLSLGGFLNASTANKDLAIYVKQDTGSTITTYWSNFRVKTL